MSAADLCALAECRINDFMFHDRAAFGGSLIAVAVLYLWLVEFGQGPFPRGRFLAPAGRDFIARWR
ncbi:MAG: hypothetical protein KY466_12355 [Gemmatimonadetes bacterium]|nr:hypothetical protein [Gemmatimonadota bacterium]